VTALVRRIFSVRVASGEYVTTGAESRNSARCVFAMRRRRGQPYRQAQSLLVIVYCAPPGLSVNPVAGSDIAGRETLDAICITVISPGPTFFQFR